MTTIPVATCRISPNNFKRHYLKNKTLFLDFFIVFPECAWNLEHLEQKDKYPGLSISEIIACQRIGYLNV